MKVNVIFGTETGETELRAEEISDVLADRFDVSVEDMEEVDVTAIDTEAFYIVACSTHGEGELPASAQPFFDALNEHSPDLSGLRYAVFGRGDHTYLNTYSRGSEIIDEKLTELDAVRVGEYGREDATDFNAPADLLETWVEGIVEHIEAVVEKVA